MSILKSKELFDWYSSCFQKSILKSNELFDWYSSGFRRVFSSLMTCSIGTHPVSDEYSEIERAVRLVLILFSKEYSEIE